MKYIPRLLRRIFYVLFWAVWLLVLLPYFFPLHFPLQNFNQLPFKESRYLNYHHTQVHYRIFPAKADTTLSPVFLIHGFSGSTASWRYVIPELNQSGRSVVAIDLPPFGYSDKRVSANLADSAWVNMIRDVMDTSQRELNLKENQKWIIAGHSMGGMVIGAFASAYPEKVKGMIYVDGTSPESDGIKNNSMLLTSAYLRLGFLHRWADVMMEKVIFSEKRFNELLSSAYLREVSEEEVKIYMDPFHFRGSASAVLRFASQSGYAKVDWKILETIPKCLVWGREDQWIPVSGAEKFLNDHLGIIGRFIEGAGHCPMETHPEQFNQMLLNDFIPILDPAGD
ncbi:MAG: alpha/beta hydrolase [Flavobacteriales bacterium]|nr:alpha/beta hydrolase [Flavobacteriales bacterium]